MTKKVYLFLFALIFTPIVINAQWVVLGGLNTSRPTENDASEQSLGFQISTFYDIHLQNNFYLKPQLIFSSEALAKKVEKPGSISGGHAISDINRLNIRENAYYLTLPISISYKIHLKKEQNIRLDGGLYAAVGLFGKTYYEIWENKTYWKSPNEEVFPNRDRLDAGWTLGISYEYKKFTYSIQSKYGFKNIDPLESSGSNLETYMFSIGYKL